MSDLAAVSRNTPCPCGSGRRYKDCHGAIAVATQVPADVRPNAAPRSSYRPPGPDWDHLSDDERAVCGLLMQKALKQQVAGRLTEASANYAQVLAKAPKTHDALHMLGAIEMRRGNFAEAKKLIRAALDLREPYPDIEHNLRMVQNLERAERVGAGRASVPPEALCQRALPALVELALRPASVQGGSASPEGAPAPSCGPIHLIAGVRDSNDEAAWLPRRIAALLAPKQPIVWDRTQRRNTGPAHRFSRDVGYWPEGGCHVFVGVDFDGAWVDRGNAERVIVFCQPAPPSQYLDQLRAISRDGARAVELVFPSRAMAARFGADLAVLPPPIALDVETSPDGGAVRSQRPFTAGLIGRHFQSSSPNEDAHFLRALAAASGSLEIYDPGPLRYAVGADPAVRCRTRHARLLREFLRSIDCLVHPAGKWWLEGDGRELFMAMAVGVPIVCPQTSIFAEYIGHGTDGLIYEGRDAALEQVRLLRRSPELHADLARSSFSKVALLAAPERAASTLRRLVFGQPDAMPFGGVGPVHEPVTAK